MAYTVCNKCLTKFNRQPRIKRFMNAFHYSDCTIFNLNSRAGLRKASTPVGIIRSPAVALSGVDFHNSYGANSFPLSNNAFIVWTAYNKIIFNILICNIPHHNFNIPSWDHLDKKTILVSILRIVRGLSPTFRRIS